MQWYWSRIPILRRGTRRDGQGMGTLWRHRSKAGNTFNGFQRGWLTQPSPMFGLGYALSLRHVEELMLERGVDVDHGAPR